MTGFVSDRALAARKAPDGATWPKCGHPRTPENTQGVGHGAVRCRICRRKLSRASMERRRAEAEG